MEMYLDLRIGRVGKRQTRRCLTDTDADADGVQRGARTPSEAGEGMRYQIWGLLLAVPFGHETAEVGFVAAEACHQAARKARAERRKAGRDCWMRGQSRQEGNWPSSPGHLGLQWTQTLHNA